VRKNPTWQRGKVPVVFAESRYLQSWAGPLQLGEKTGPQQPVIDVSWFAADAYCQSIGARLPTWSEWEYAAAADETRKDARNDPAWRERILGWYSRPSSAPLAQVGSSAPNVYGVQDLHGLVWEWTEDYASMLVSGDSREQKAQDRLKFCGAGAIGMDDRENYAVLMRVAMLSALEADDVTANLGFRCAVSKP
jgi:formylglycine-generating enzyme required for sulfatase activity